MKIYGMEKLSLVDFEGHLAATLFTGGCNFCCPFCHNSSLALNDRGAVELDQNEIFDYLIKRKGILDAVCISGGEPTIHADLPEFVEKVKRLGYLIKLDTNGTNPKMVEVLVNKGLVDYVAMDIKSGKSGYPLAVGIEGFDIKAVRQTVDFLINNKTDGFDYEFRTTLVYELISEEDVLEMAEWLKGAKRLFLQHFVDSGDCIVEGLSAVDFATAERYMSILQKNIGRVELRNY